MMKCTRRFSVPERMFGPAVCASSVLVASVLVFTVVIADWFVVHMAILAPIIACLCYEDSFRELFAKSLQNMIGVCLGGLIGKLWIFLIRLVAHASTGSYNYNQYLAVAVSLPWVFGFHLLLPRRLVSASAAVLVFLTLVMYSGYSEAPDAYPLRAVLSGCIGGLISLLVGFIVSRFFINPAVRPRSVSKLHEALGSYWDALIDEAISPGSPQDTLFLRNDLLRCICEMNDHSLSTHAIRCFESLAAIDTILQSKAFTDTDSASGTACARLIEMKSRVVLSHGSDQGISAAQSLAKIAEAEGNLRLSSVAPIMVSFVKRAMRFSAECEKSVSLRRDTDVMISSLFPVKWTPDTSLPNLFKATRFSLSIIGLSQLLVFWDATDTSVDTYALWAFVPALLVAERIQYIGEAVVIGAWYLLSAFLGSGSGVLCLLLSQAGRQSFLGEFIIVLIIGLFVQSKRSVYGDSGLVFIFSWIICVLGNLGLDPSSDFVPPSSGNELNILWRIALYRSAITCFAVFAMALSFLIFPAPSATAMMKKESDRLAQDACNVVAMTSDESQKSSEFLLSSVGNYQTLNRWKQAEFFTKKLNLNDPQKLSDLVFAAAAVLGGIASFDAQVSPSDYEPVEALRDASVQLSLELTTREKLQLRVRMKDLREAFLKTKRWMSDTDGLIIESHHVNTLVIADLLAELVRKTLPLAEEFSPEQTLENV